MCSSPPCHPRNAKHAMYVDKAITCKLYTLKYSKLTSILQYERRQKHNKRLRHKITKSQITGLCRHVDHFVFVTSFVFVNIRPTIRPTKDRKNEKTRRQVFSSKGNRGFRLGWWGLQHHLLFFFSNHRIVDGNHRIARRRRPRISNTSIRSLRTIRRSTNTPG